MKQTSGKPGRERILIIEDEPDIITVMKGILQNESYIVDSALGGAEGIKKITKEKPDLALLDIRMPEVSGRDVLDFMQKNNIDIPVVVVTAVAATATVRNELESRYGIAGFVSKPYLTTDLVPEIKRALAKRKK